MTLLKAWRLWPQAEAPLQATEQSACWDLRACLVDDQKVEFINEWNERSSRVVTNQSITLFGHERMLMPTGWVFDIPMGYSMRVHARSGMAWKQGICLANSQGVIDSDYVEQTYVMLHNTTEVSWVINHGDRIAQLELLKTNAFDLQVTSERPTIKSSRLGGFGHTGVSG